MTAPHAHLTPIRVAQRQRAGRALRPFNPPTGARVATTAGAAKQAECLVADLLTLVDSGLITPVADGDGAVRYTLTDDAIECGA